MSTPLTGHQLWVTSRTRPGGYLRSDSKDVPADPSIADVLSAIPKDATEVWLGGGEPTLRPDLPELTAALASLGVMVGLHTDGLALAQADAARPLVSAGLRRARVTLHAARADAHDFLVGTPGAAKRAVRAVGRLKALGVRVELAAVLTRPTVSLVAELVQLAARLGVEGLHVSRLVAEGAVADEAILLVPRALPTARELARALVEAKRRGVSLWVHGFPLCFARSAEHARVPSASAATLPNSSSCPDCPGQPQCTGLPVDYVRRFGLAEFQPKSPPRAPSLIRVRFGGPSSIACEVCADAALTAGEAVEPTRSVRLALVRAARVGAKTLRVVGGGTLDHPDLAALLRETTLLSFERVEVAGECSPLNSLTDPELYALTGIHELQLALFGPDAESHDAHVGRRGAFAAALEGAARFGRLCGGSVTSYAVLHDASRVADFARAWDHGELPGPPRFRLSPRGGCLAALAEAFAALSEGPARRALSAVLPACRGGSARGDHEVDAAREAKQESAPAGAQPEGEFTPCGCGRNLAGCVGLAPGWSWDAAATPM